jgi:tRNA A-37 threonylcarbamoyl transferase component Bud32
MLYVKSWTQRAIYDAKFASPQLLHLLNNLDFEISKAKSYLKNDPTSTVCLYELNGEMVVIKRSNTKNRLHFLRRSFRKSRAFRSWDNAKRLIGAGIATFEPIAAVENRWGPFKGRSYLISSYLGGKQASSVFALGAKPVATWPKIAKNIIGLINQLSNSSLSHRDLNLSNIILINQKPFLIDLDGMQQHRWSLLAKYYASQDQKRFMKNWVELPGVNPKASQLFQNIVND